MKEAKSIIVLTAIAVAAAALLSLVDSTTASARDGADRAFKLASIEEVLPAYDNDPDSDSVEVTLESGSTAVLYPGRKGDVLVGVAIELATPPAYGGTVGLLVGVDTEGRVSGIKILPGHQETPGLGAKVEEEGWRSQFTGRALDGETVWDVKKDNAEGFVDSVTGATITSRAVTDGVEQALETFEASRHEVE